MATVLVVDDSIADQRMVGGLLQAEPELQAVYASNGREALEQLERHLPDIVVTDMIMPEMNGFELVTAVREEYPLIPVVLMTSQGSEEIAVKALERGAASYVPKNSLGEDLLETVQRVLAASGEERSHSRVMNRMTRSESNFVLENDVALISSLVDYLRQTMKTVHLFDDTECLRAGIAVNEALLNALFHGNLEIGADSIRRTAEQSSRLAAQRREQTPYCDRKIHVRATFTPADVVFVVRDEGMGFDTSRIRGPGGPIDLEARAGRGITLMQTFMDGVQFSDMGNTVTLTKRRADGSEKGLDEELV